MRPRQRTPQISSGLNIVWASRSISAPSSRSRGTCLGHRPTSVWQMLDLRKEAGKSEQFSADDVLSVHLWGYKCSVQSNAVPMCPPQDPPPCTRTCRRWLERCAGCGSCERESRCRLITSGASHICACLFQLSCFMTTLIASL